MEQILQDSSESRRLVNETLAVNNRGMEKKGETVKLKKKGEMKVKQQRDRWINKAKKVHE